MLAAVCGELFTRNPVRLFTMHIHFSYPLAYHLLQTLNSIRYMIAHFQTFTYDLIDHKFWSHKLQITVTSDRWEALEKMLTLTAVVKASFHEPYANFSLAHSLKSN